MDSLCARANRRLDKPLADEVALPGGPGPDRVRLVCHADVLVFRKPDVVLAGKATHEVPAEIARAA